MKINSEIICDEQYCNLPLSVKCDDCHKDLCRHHSFMFGELVVCKSCEKERIEDGKNT